MINFIKRLALFTTVISALAVLVSCSGQEVENVLQTREMIDEEYYSEVFKDVSEEYVEIVSEDGCVQLPEGFFANEEADTIENEIIIDTDMETSEENAALQKESEAEYHSESVIPVPVVIPEISTEYEEIQVSPVPSEADYVLNTNTRKFHYPSCNSVDEMKQKNKAYHTGTREEVIAMGYKSCGRCHP